MQSAFTSSAPVATAISQTLGVSNLSLVISQPLVLLLSPTLPQALLDDDRSESIAIGVGIGLGAGLVLSFGVGACALWIHLGSRAKTEPTGGASTRIARYDSFASWLRLGCTQPRTHPTKSQGWDLSSNPMLGNNL